MSASRLVTVVRVKATTTKPTPGCRVSVLAVDSNDRPTEWHTTDPVCVGDTFCVSIEAVRS